MGAESLTVIANAKDGYQLALGVLCISLVAIMWAVRYITDREKVFSLSIQELNAINLKTIVDTNATHVLQVERLNEKHNSAIERLIEAHRNDVASSVDKLTIVINSLYNECSHKRRGVDINESTG